MAAEAELSPRACTASSSTDLPMEDDFNFKQDDFPDIESWELDGSRREDMEGSDSNLSIENHLTFNEDDFPDLDMWELNGIDEDAFSDINPHELGGPSPLLHLPEELFAMTMAYCVQRAGSDSTEELRRHRRSLQSLRLVHPCFSNHKPLQQELDRTEHTVAFTPEMDQLCNLKDKLPMIAPSVRKVVFRPARFFRSDLDKIPTATSRTLW